MPTIPEIKEKSNPIPTGILILRLLWQNRYSKLVKNFGGNLAVQVLGLSREKYCTKLLCLSGTGWAATWMDRRGPDPDPDVSGNLLRGKIGILVQWAKDAMFSKRVRITRSPSRGSEN